MTAEETALEEFRLLAKCARDEMRTAKMMRAERDSDARWFFTMAREHRIQMSSLARIIRAIRAERGQERRDALREAIDLCRHTEAGDTTRDWREAAKCCRELIESLASGPAKEVTRVED